MEGTVDSEFVMEGAFSAQRRGLLSVLLFDVSFTV